MPHTGVAIPNALAVFAWCLPQLTDTPNMHGEQIDETEGWVFRAAQWVAEHQEKGPYVDMRFFFDVHVRFRMHVDMHFFAC
jgi:hypothetical protein